MGKTIRFDVEDITKHTPGQQELIEKDWKHRKQKKATKVFVSDKLRNGYFTQQHTWPIANESKSGKRKI